MGNQKKIIATINTDATLIYLNDNQKRALLDYVGYDDEDQFKQSIATMESDEEIELERETYNRGQQFLINAQTILSMYELGIENLDNAPTPNDKAKKFKEIGLLANDLHDQLIRLGPHDRAELKNKKYDTVPLIAELSKFLFQSQRIIQKNSNTESRGRNKARARQAIVNYLSHCFDDYCELEDVPEKNKMDFIKMALSYADIPHPKNIKRLFYRQGDKQIVFNQIQ